MEILIVRLYFVGLFSIRFLTVDLFVDFEYPFLFDYCVSLFLCLLCHLLSFFHRY